MHHQAIDKLGKDLKISCKCQFDGVIEGVEHISKPIFGVQFHPERLALEHFNDSAINGLCLIRNFVKLCEEN
jgi:putative glutamine amidotransferase